MVLARRIGRPRPFPLVLLLYVATFGIYGIYWHYKAHNEVHRQFELDLEGREDGLVWLILDRVFFPLRWIYQYGFVANVAHVRRRLGREDGLSPATFVSLTIPGSTLTYAGLLMVLVAEGLEMRLAVIFYSVGIGIYVVGAVLQVVAFAALQGELNRVWNDYDRRLLELMPPYVSPPGGARPGVPIAGPSNGAPPSWSPAPQPGPGQGPR